MNLDMNKMGAIMDKFVHMPNLYKTIPVLLFVLMQGMAFSQANRSDTVDILHTKVHLDITDFAGQRIAGYATLKCAFKQSGVKNLNLDLLKLTMDSVLLMGAPLSTQYNDTLLQISLGQAYQPGDTIEVTVYYHGQPFKESWGGFRFDADHAFQLGVGFNTDPHSLGRSWIPCFDNFVERCTFKYEIITADGRTSYCNGELTGQVSLSGDTIMRTWEMKEAIPSYLANVAVSDYQELAWNHSGVAKNIPVLLAVRATDSTKLRASFSNLDGAITSFENAFGPYRFNKVGYCIVPMSGGMEHASNISYARNLVNGNTNYESVMAHELAHMWWGDLVTCDKQEEMWINEGMASYCEHVFFEDVYGPQRYVEEVKANFIKCIQYLHITEGKYWAIQGIPHSMTYSSHVYDKGAVVAHNLRGYMGDAKFFNGLQRFLDDHAFTDVNSMLLRDKLEQYSGLDLHDFFDDWVFGPGYTDFTIDSFKVSPGPALNQVDVFIHQKQVGSGHFFNKVPLEITFYDAGFNELTEKVEASGEFSSFNFSLPIQPVLVVVNRDHKLNISPTADQDVIRSPGTYEFENGKWELEIASITDSVLIRVEHHWASADKGPSNYRMSPDRFWEVKGLAAGPFSAKAVITFDARSITSGGDGNLDNELMKNGVDSMVLMYRADASEQWSEYKHYKKVQFGPIPFGLMELDSVLFGQYAFAKGISYLDVFKSTRGRRNIRIYPNPSTDILRIENLDDLNDELDLLIYDTGGRLIWKQAFKNPTDIDTSTFRSGSYFMVMNCRGEQVWSDHLIVSH